MVVRSDSHCLHAVDWPQDGGLKNPEDLLACSRVQIEKRLKPPNDQVLKCPRCDSYNTKFCYYNNYSLSQPRHFCKNCRRYWTKGGALRNVPVGGGCRKNKRTKQRSAEQCSASHQNDSVATNLVGESTNSSGQPSGSMYFHLPIEGDEVNLSTFSPSHGTLRLADQNSMSSGNPGIFGAAGASQLSCLPHNTLNSLNNHVSGVSGFQILRNGLAGMDHLTGSVRHDQGNLGFGDLTNIFDMTHQQFNSQTSACAPMSNGNGIFNLTLNTLRGIDSDMQWKLQRQKMASDGTDEHIGEGQTAVTLGSDEGQQAVENLRHPTSRSGLAILPPCTKVEERHRTVDWQVGQEGLFEAATEHNYWNSGVWSDLPCYGPSTSSFL